MVGCFCCWLPFVAFPIWIITFQKFTEVSIMKKNLTELVFVLDRSGSMSGLEKDTIGGFNSMLGRQKERYGWEFLFLGANIDAIETAGRFGIQPSRAVNYECDSAGTQLNFQVVSDTVRVLTTASSPSWITIEIYPLWRFRIPPLAALR